MSTKKLRSGRVSSRALASTIAMSTAALLAACSAGTTGTSSGGDQASVDPSGPIQILVPTETSSDAAFAKVNAAFEKKYPKVTVKYTSVVNDSFLAARSSRLSAGTVDITVVYPQNVPSYVNGQSESDDDRALKAGVFVDLTKQSFMKNLSPSVLEAAKFSGKNYTFPVGLSYYGGVFYNKTIFEKYGLSVPTTWTEFVKVADTLKQNGVTPVGIGGKDSWPAGLTMLAVNGGTYPTPQDKNALAEGLWKGTIKLTDAKPLSVLERTAKVFSYAQPNWAGVSYATMPSSFVKGDFAMMPDGSWSATTIAAAAGNDFKYGYFPFPGGDDAASNQHMDGKIELNLAVTNNSKNKGAALAYMKFFADPATYGPYSTASGYLPSEPNIPLPAALDAVKNIPFTPGWDQIWIPNVNAGKAAVFPFNYTGIKPLGTGTVAQAAAKAQSDWAVTK